MLVVARPDPPWDAEPESRGNMLLTDASGCDPRVLGGDKRLAAKLGKRVPVADVVLRRGDELESLWLSIND